MKRIHLRKLARILRENITSIEADYVDFKRWAIEYGTTELFREHQWELPGDQEFTRSLEQTVEMEQPGQMFDILSRIWEMWNDESIEDKQEFGKALYNTMKEDDFFFDKEANGAKVGMDRQDADYLRQTYGVEMNEQFNLKNMKKSELKKLIKETIQEQRTTGGVTKEEVDRFINQLQNDPDYSHYKIPHLLTALILWKLLMTPTSAGDGSTIYP